jgi:hypothetical protein
MLFSWSSGIWFRRSKFWAADMFWFIAGVEDGSCFVGSYLVGTSSILGSSGASSDSILTLDNSFCFLLSTLGSVITSPLVSSATDFSFKMILSNSVLTSE